MGAKNTIIKSITVFLAIAALAACSSISVTTDWDPGIDFSKFKTFAVLENTEESINRLTDQRIRTALVAELTSRGLQKVDSPEMADLAIAYLVTTEQRTSFQTVHSGMGAGHGFHHNNVRFHGSLGTSRTTQHNYTVGTLIIAAYQMGNKELVWEGSASDIVNTTSRNPEQNQQHINDAVQKILKDFPPGVTRSM